MQDTTLYTSVLCFFIIFISKIESSPVPQSICSLSTDPNVIWLLDRGREVAARRLSLFVWVFRCLFLLPFMPTKVHPACLEKIVGSRMYPPIESKPSRLMEFFENSFPELTGRPWISPLILWRDPCWMVSKTFEATGPPHARPKTHLWFSMLTPFAVPRMRRTSWIKDDGQPNQLRWRAPCSSNVTKTDMNFELEWWWRVIGYTSCCVYRFEQFCRYKYYWRHRL